MGHDDTRWYNAAVDSTETEIHSHDHHLIIIIIAVFMFMRNDYGFGLFCIVFMSTNTKCHVSQCFFGNSNSHLYSSEVFRFDSLSWLNFTFAFERIIAVTINRLWCLSDCSQQWWWYLEALASLVRMNVFHNPFFNYTRCCCCLPTD